MIFLNFGFFEAPDSYKNNSYIKKVYDITKYYFGCFVSSHTKEQVLSTSYLAAAYVKNVLKLPEDKKVYVIGMPGLVDEFNLLNIKTIGPGVRLKKRTQMNSTIKIKTNKF